MSNHTDTIRTVRRRINDIRNPTYLVEKKHQEAKPKDHNFIHSGEEKSPLQVRQIHDKVENDEDTAGEDVKLERTKGESEEANLKRRGNMSRSGPYDGKDFGNDEAYVWESPKKSIDEKIDSLKVSHLYSYEIRKQGTVEGAGPAILETNIKDYVDSSIEGFFTSIRAKQADFEKIVITIGNKVGSGIEGGAGNIWNIGPDTVTELGGNPSTILNEISKLYSGKGYDVYPHEADKENTIIISKGVPTSL